MRCPGRILLVLVSLLILPSIAHAQASITGVVRDASGAVLPGVTVEAASPALIEKARSVVTDDSGQYRIVDLRPGTYSVTFSLPGFNTVQREGIELTGSFVATVNADLRVGALTETITVTGESPIVDVQSSTQQRSITADIIAAIPTGRSLVNLTILIPGMVAFSPRGLSDVGGTDNLQNTFVSIHGGRPEDQRTLIDGISIRNLLGTGNSTNFTPDIGSTQEVAVDYAATTADQITGGVRVNYIPREGGNRFSALTLRDGRELVVPGRQLLRRAEERGPDDAEPAEADLRREPDLRGADRAGQDLVLRLLRVFRRTRTTWRASSTTRTRVIPTRGPTCPTENERGVFNIIRRAPTAASPTRRRRGTS